MSSCISAIGTANPPHRIAQENIFHFMVNAFNLEDNHAARLKQIYDHSGIDYRYSVIPDFGQKNYQNHTFFSTSKNLEPFPGTRRRLQLYQQTAGDIAAQAINNCLQFCSGNLISQITHLITVSCTGMHAPGIDIELVEKLGLNRHVERTCINFMGCYGALNALKVADYICRANEKAKALIVCIELCTLHFQKENTLDNWVSNALFSDGAAAVLVENQMHKTDTPHRHLKLNTFYSEFMHQAGSEMGWQVGNTGFEMKLTSKVPKLIKHHIRPIAQQLLNKAGLKLADISRFAIHPGGKKILEAAESALEFDPCANRFAYETLREYGNMSSATVLFVLKKLLEYPQARSGEYILGFAFGPGLTVESMILQRY